MAMIGSKFKKTAFEKQFILSHKASIKQNAIKFPLFESLSLTMDRIQVMFVCRKKLRYCL